MVVTPDGTLMSAYPDTCTNYVPDKHKATGVVSLKLGILYECKNYNHGNHVDQGCYWCVNKDYEGCRQALN